MAIYMPPLCRKKQVQGRYNPDSFRVISTFAEDTHPKYLREQTENISEWRKQWRENEGLALPDIYNRKTEVLPHEAPDYRVHKPHPGSCGFLRHNVRLLNEPICTVFTEVTRSEQQNWWPSRTSAEPLHVPPHTNDTIYREDFQMQETGASSGALRHTAKPITEPALGTVPVNFLRARDGKQRFFKEKISYEHIYNSRVGDNYPIRGKRQGSFVWDQMNPDATKKFIDHYQIISAEEGILRQQNMEAESKVRQSTEISKILNETAIDTHKEEVVTEEPTVVTSLPKDELASPKLEPNAELTEFKPWQAVEPTVQKSASPLGSKKGSQKSSAQTSPKQRLSPKHSPKQSSKGSRANSKDEGQSKSPPRSPKRNGVKQVEEIKIDLLNSAFENYKTAEGDQTIGG